MGGVVGATITVGVEGAGAGWQAVSSSAKMAITEMTAHAPVRRDGGLLFSFMDFLSSFFLNIPQHSGSTGVFCNILNARWRKVVPKFSLSPG
jgi:hypothetical protein